MRIKFYADDFNARLVWHWIDGVHETEDSEEIENLKGLGLRFETVEETKEKPAKKAAKKGKLLQRQSKKLKKNPPRKQRKRVKDG